MKLPPTKPTKLDSPLLQQLQSMAGGQNIGGAMPPGVQTRSPRVPAPAVPNPNAAPPKKGKKKGGYKAPASIY